MAREAVAVPGLHEIVWVDGDDAVTFLDGLVSQDIAAMAVGDVARSFLLSPRGKLQALLWVLRGDRRCGLVADAGWGGVVTSGLQRFLIRVRAEISQPTRLSAVWGAQAADVLAAAGAVTADGWHDERGILAARLPARVVDRWLVGGVGVEVLTERGAVAAGEAVTTSARVEAGEPVMGIDIDEGTIPQETGLMQEAVSYDKGCYLGQELVARIETRGHVNRMLRGMIIDGDVAPGTGAAVVHDGEVVGTATSVGTSHRLGCPVAMGLLRVAAGPGARVMLQWDDAAAAATVAELPLDPSLATTSG